MNRRPGKDGSPVVRSLKRFATGIGVVVLGGLLWQSVSWVNRPRQLSFTEFLAAVQANTVEHVTLTGTDIVGRFKGSGAAFHTVAPTQYQGLANVLVDQGIAIDAVEPSLQG